MISSQMWQDAAHAFGRWVASDIPTLVVLAFLLGALARGGYLVLERESRRNGLKYFSAAGAAIVVFSLRVQDDSVSWVSWVLIVLVAVATIAALQVSNALHLYYKKPEMARMWNVVVGLAVVAVPVADRLAHGAYQYSSDAVLPGVAVGCALSFILLDGVTLLGAWKRGAKLIELRPTGRSRAA